MDIGMVGLGRMGANMAARLKRGGHRVAGFDPGAAARVAAEVHGIETSGSLAALVAALRSVGSRLAPPQLLATPPFLRG